MNKSLVITIVLVSTCVGCLDNKSSSEKAEILAQLENVREQVKDLESERKTLREEIDQRKRQVRELGLNKKKKDKEKKTDEAKPEQLEDCENYIALLEENLVQVEEQLTLWREPVRTSLAGRNFRGLELENGKKIDEVIIDEIRDDGVSLSVGAENRSFAWADLSPRMRVILLDEETIAAEAIK